MNSNQPPTGRASRDRLLETTATEVFGGQGESGALRRLLEGMEERDPDGGELQAIARAMTRVAGLETSSARLAAPIVLARVGAVDAGAFAEAVAAVAAAAGRSVLVPMLVREEGLAGLEAGNRAAPARVHPLDLGRALPGLAGLLEGPGGAGLRPLLESAAALVPADPPVARLVAIDASEFRIGVVEALEAGGTGDVPWGWAACYGDDDGRTRYARLSVFRRRGRAGVLTQRDWLRDEQAPPGREAAGFLAAAALWSVGGAADFAAAVAAVDAILGACDS